MLETTPKAKPCNPSKIRKGKAFQVTRPRISQQVGISQGHLEVKGWRVFSGETFSPMEFVGWADVFFLLGGTEGAIFHVVFRGEGNTKKTEAWNFFLAKRTSAKKRGVKFILKSHVQVSEAPKSTAKAN